MRNLSKVKLILLFVAGLLFAGCGNRGSQGGPQQAGQEVKVVTMRTERVILTEELPGRTSAFIIAEIRPQVNGLIQKRLFIEGSQVKAGEVLYQIDPAQYQAAYDKVKANLPALKLKAERYQEALAEKAVSQQEFDDANAAYRQAEAELENARINLDYTQVTSPVSGRIGASSVTDGDIVTAYQATPLATVQQLDPIYVDIPQSTAELLRLRKSYEDGKLNSGSSNQNKVKLILEDGSVYPIEGRLEFQDVTVDPSTGSVILRVLFANPQSVLLPGMFVRAIITEGINEQAILVPQQGVFRNPKGEAMAFIVDSENKVQQRMLTVEKAIGDKWLVSAGLNPGDRVIVEGLQKVRPGMPVKPIAFEENKK